MIFVILNSTEPRDLTAKLETCVQEPDKVCEKKHQTSVKYVCERIKSGAFEQQQSMIIFTMKKTFQARVGFDIE